MNDYEFLQTLFKYYFPWDSAIYDEIEEQAYLFGKIIRHCIRTANHCIRVSLYSMLISKYFCLSKADKNILWNASLFHDVGKIAVPLSILDKPSDLTSQEYNLVKEHSAKGFLIANHYDSLRKSKKAILYHHERYDGKGYPRGISENEIPFLSKIISVCDAFDAMTSERTYKTSYSFDEAKNELRKNKWKQFDGEIVDSFISMLDEDKHITEEIRMILKFDYDNLSPICLN